MLAFTRYLNADKFDISVITMQDGKAMTEEAHDNIHIYRELDKQTIPLFKHYQGEKRFKHLIKVVWNVAVRKLIPKPHKAWSNSVNKRLTNINNSKPIDLVISSFSPIEAHIGAQKFLNNHLDIPWVADMRDEMSSNPQIPESTRKRLKHAEKLINQRAQAITTVSHPILDVMKRSMPTVNVFEEIRNGFDHNIKAEVDYNQIFTMAYAGTFYGARKPNTFFEGLRLFLNDAPCLIKIQFIGTHHNFSIPTDCQEFCEFIPPVSNDEAVQLMANADATLLILNGLEGRGVYSGKIFDYISVLKPVIAILDPTDVAADLILETKSGFIADFNKPEEIKLAIESAYTIWKSRTPMQMEFEKITALHRKHQVKKLEGLILKLLQP
jgi:glycosyltransferase involved in cell wall biosynthesis